MIALSLLAVAGGVLGALRPATRGVRVPGMVSAAVLFIAFVIQMLARSQIVDLGLEPGEPVLVWVLAVALASCVLIINIRWPGALWAVAGGILNIAVVVANKGMPVLVNMADASRAERAIAAAGGFYVHAAGSRWVLLGDAIRIPGPFGGATLVSVGDLLIFFGVGWMIGAVIRLEGLRCATMGNSSTSPQDDAVPSG